MACCIISSGKGSGRLVAGDSRGCRRVHRRGDEYSLVTLCLANFQDPCASTSICTAWHTCWVDFGSKDQLMLLQGFTEEGHSMHTRAHVTFWSRASHVLEMHHSPEPVRAGDGRFAQNPHSLALHLNLLHRKTLQLLVALHMQGW